VTPDSPRHVVARELAPFALATLVAFALLPIGGAPDWSEYAAALGLMTVTFSVTVLAPWSALPASARLVLPVAFLGAVALLRESGGGQNTGVAILSLLPVFWVALHGTRLELAVTIAGVGAFFAVPVVLVGGPDYPASGLRSGTLFMLVAGLLGETIQRLVAEVRAQAALGRREALTDALTGAGNRRAWDRWLELAATRCSPRARTRGAPTSAPATSSRGSAARSSPSSSPPPTSMVHPRWYGGWRARPRAAPPARAASRSGTAPSGPRR
jgi:hypothetical protein